MRGTSLSGISRRLLSSSQPRRSFSEKIHCTDFQAAAKCPLLVPKRELGNEGERFLSRREMLAPLSENGIFSPHGNIRTRPAAKRRGRSPALVAAAQPLSLVCSRRGRSGLAL